MTETDRSRPGAPLAKAIADLRGELLQALAEGQDKELRTGEVNAGVKFWVLAFGAKGSAEQTGTHTLKLTLEPVDKNGNEFFVSDNFKPA